MPMTRRPFLSLRSASSTVNAAMNDTGNETTTKVRRAWTHGPLARGGAFDASWSEGGGVRPYYFADRARKSVSGEEPTAAGSRDPAQQQIGRESSSCPLGAKTARMCGTGTPPPRFKKGRCIRGSVGTGSLVAVWRRSVRLPVGTGRRDAHPGTMSAMGSAVV